MKVSDFFQSNFFKCDDIKGNEMTVVMERVEPALFKGRDGKEKPQPLVYFQGIEKPLGCNKTNTLTIAEIVGSDDMDDWPGHEIVLFRSVTNVEGKPVNCVRVRGPYKPPQRAVPRQTAVAPRTTQPFPSGIGKQQMPGYRGDDEPPPHDEAPWESQR